jgi:hypothetical protein
VRSPARLGRRGVPGSKRWYGLPLAVANGLASSFPSHLSRKLFVRSRRALTSSIIYSEHTKWFYIPTDRSRVTAIMRGDKVPRHLLWRVVGRGADHDPPGRSMMRGPTVLTSGHSSMASAGGSTPAGLGGHGPWFSGVRAPELATNRQGMPWIVAGLWSRCGRHLVHQTVFRHSADSSSVLDLERVCNIGTCGLPRRVLAFQVFA